MQRPCGEKHGRCMYKEYRYSVYAGNKVVYLHTERMLKGMKIRRMVSLLVVLMLLSMGAQAQTAATVLSSCALPYGSVILNDYNNLLVFKDYSTDTYTLLTADGTALTSEPYVDMQSDGAMFVVALEEGVNTKGLINGSGNLVMPMQYEEIDVLSERWQLGAVYTESKGLFKSGYQLSYYDVYYQGKPVGELKGVNFTYADAYGAYLGLYDGIDRTFYDSNLNRSTYKPSGSTNNEYDVTQNGTFHLASGQQVGVPECTLTRDDVESDIVVVGDAIVDLQGNRYGALGKEYNSVGNFQNGYADVRLDGKIGIIDYTGREVVPCEYDEIYCSEWFKSGYVIAVKDGKVGYLNKNGEVTCEFKYSTDEVINHNWVPMIWKYNDDETVTVLSAAAGELPGRYEKVELERSDDGCPMFMAQVSEGKVGVFDMYGEEIIPADGTFDNVYDFQISYDGSVIVAALEFGHEVVYRMSDAYGLQSATETEIPKAPAAQPEAPAAQPETSAEQPAEAGWTCSCGSVNSGNFCPECGSARPEEVKCSACGFVPEAGATPKFCEECGNQF